MHSEMQSLRDSIQSVSESSRSVEEQVGRISSDRKAQEDLIHILNEECYHLGEIVRDLAGRRGVSHTKPEGGLVTFEATAYTDGGVTANGYNLAGKGWTDAMVVAVDPDIIPLGSKVYVEFDGEWSEYSGVYSAEDTGGAIEGNIVDIFVGHGEDRRAFQFGRRNVRLKVLDGGGYLGR